MAPRGNPNFTTPERMTFKEITMTQFEFQVDRIGLSDKPNYWEHSGLLRAWAKQHRSSHYVPEWLLKAWGLQLKEYEIC